MLDNSCSKTRNFETATECFLRSPINSRPQCRKTYLTKPMGHSLLLLGRPCAVRGPFLSTCGQSGVALGPLWDRFRLLLSRSWGALAPLGAPLSFLGAPWAALEVLLAARRMTLTTLGSLLVAVGVLCAALGSVLGCSRPTFGRS